MQLACHQRGVLVDQPQPVGIHHHGQAAAPHRPHDLQMRVHGVSGWVGEVNRSLPVTCKHACCSLSRPGDTAPAVHVLLRAAQHQQPWCPSAHLGHGGEDERVPAQPRPNDHRIKSVQPRLNGLHRLLPRLFLGLRGRSRMAASAAEWMQVAVRQWNTARQAGVKCRRSFITPNPATSTHPCAPAPLHPVGWSRAGRGAQSAPGSSL